ncbi:DUF1484 family protein [Chromobacterium phragmitis]|uniref:DUF1484 family protein n=1 Tax=Chromobacterium phragmitis TaxID=2202141 RepID=UPI0039A1319A
MPRRCNARLKGSYIQSFQAGYCTLRLYDASLQPSRIKELLEPLDKRMGESLTLLTRVL